jgi:hypothetical protein
MRVRLDQGAVLVLPRCSPAPRASPWIREQGEWLDPPVPLSIQATVPTAAPKSPEQPVSAETGRSPACGGVWRWDWQEGEPPRSGAIQMRPR